MNDDERDLRELICRPISRKVSLEKTDECPTWNSIISLWEESDEHLRQRMRKEQMAKKADGEKSG